MVGEILLCGHARRRCRQSGAPAPARGADERESSDRGTDRTRHTGVGRGAEGRDRTRIGDDARDRRRDFPAAGRPRALPHGCRRRPLLHPNDGGDPLRAPVTARPSPAQRLGDRQWRRPRPPVATTLVAAGIRLRPTPGNHRGRPRDLIDRPPPASVAASTRRSGAALVAPATAAAAGLLGLGIRQRIGCETKECRPRVLEGVL